MGIIDVHTLYCFTYDIGGLLIPPSRRTSSRTSSIASSSTWGVANHGWEEPWRIHRMQYVLPVNSHRPWQSSGLED